jgi:hypothetical protein
MFKLTSPKLNQPVTMAHLQRITDAINSNAVEIQGFAKRVTAGGTVFAPPNWSVTAPTLAYGVIISGWDADTQYNYVGVLQSDSLGVPISGSGYGSGSGFSGYPTTRIYLYSPENGSGLGFHYQYQSGVVITYFPIITEDYNYTTSPDPTYSGNVGWAFPIYSEALWGVVTSYTQGLPYCFINPAWDIQGDLIPYTFDAGFGGGILKCYLADPIPNPDAPGTGLFSLYGGSAIGGTDGGGNTLPLQAGDIIKISLGSNGLISGAFCYASSPLISYSGAGSIPHILLDGYYNSDTVSGDAQLAGMITGQLDIFSGVKWNILSGGHVPTVLVMDDTAAPVPQPRWLTPPASGAGNWNRVLIINSDAPSGNVRWSTSTSHPGQFLMASGTNFDIDWSAWPQESGQLMYAAASGNPQWGSGFSSGSSGINCFAYLNSGVPMWSNSGTSGGVAIIDIFNTPKWLDLPTEVPYQYPSGSGSNYFPSLTALSGGVVAWTLQNSLPSGIHSGDILKWNGNAYPSGFWVPTKGVPFTVTLTLDGGSDGTATSACTYTYTAIDMDGVTVGTHLTPAQPRTTDGMLATPLAGYGLMTGNILLTAFEVTDAEGLISP